MVQLAPRVTIRQTSLGIQLRTLLRAQSHVSVFAWRKAENDESEKDP